MGSARFASRISGIGSAFPSRKVTNVELAQLYPSLDTSDEWIRERTGILERRIAQPGNTDDRNSSLACIAAQRALEMAGKQASDLDQILVATCTPDTLIPSTACWLQQKLGANRAWTMDLNAACSGFIYALATADQFIQNGQLKTSLIVGSDVLSAFTNWEDRSSCILFGDGAGAVIVEQAPSNSPNRLLSHHLHSDGSLWELFHIEAGGSKLPGNPEVYTQKRDKMQMKGREIFKSAVRTLAEYAVMALEENGYSVSDLDWFVPHQANLRIIEAVAKRINFPMSKVLLNIDRFGNTSSATIPTALDEAVRDHRVRPGQLILLDAFGAGLTTGSLLLRWG
ncbi:beta-ketoacyl-ACP synthase III [Bdellovibrionota bacterium FG-2]